MKRMLFMLGVLLWAGLGMAQDHAKPPPFHKLFPTWSPDGTHIAFIGLQGENLDLFVMKANATHQTQITHSPLSEFSYDWSPDGTQIVFAASSGTLQEIHDRQGNSDLYIMNSDGSNRRQLTDDPAFESDPHWSPDGTQIAFTSNRENNVDLYLMPVDGSEPGRLTDHPEIDIAGPWSPDGTSLLFTTLRDGNAELYTMNVKSRSLTRLTRNPKGDWNPTWSADGTQIYFNADRDGNREVYRMEADGSNPTRITYNSALENRPHPSPDNTEIAFASTRDGTREIYVMRLDGTRVDRLTYQPQNLSTEAQNAQPYWLALSVANVDSSAAWYREKLGFTLLKQIDLPTRNIRMRFVALNDFVLELVETQSSQALDALKPDYRNARASLRGIYKFGLLLDDVDALYERLQQQGVPHMRSIIDDQAFGLRSFLVEDPDGNLIQISEKMDN